ncbi:MAG: hypothetical protein HUJ91_02635, partial [Bacteroidales bacterium]|nr:hypothetical protein [Bacteroidales bacterium]
LDSTCIRELDSLYACYCDSICMTLHDSRDIKMLIKQQKKEYRDSVIQNTPRILETFVLPDSLYYERILSWTHNQYNNNVTLVPIDTSYNYHFYDNPIFKDATDAIYLGVAGSAALPMNYFQREELDVAPFFNPYLPYSYTPETLRMYNTKTPYTELAYWGNPFMDKEKEESDLKLLCTQNITPEMNLTFEYQRYGASGMLQRERTDNRSYNIGVNYIGKKYELNAAFMGQSVKRFENGGIKDIFWVCDTTIDTKAIDVNLKSAENTLKRKTLFLTQSLAVPLNFFRKDKDSLSVGDGTVIYLGHSLEYSKYSKLYTDVIGDGSGDERAFYNNEFNIFNNASCDSLAVTRFENKFFATLQPFGADAIVSKLNVGAGYQLLRFYSFAFDQFVTGAKVKPSNGTYLYANADGTFRKYVAWDAFGKMTTTGYYAGDFKLAGNVRLSVYPIKEGIHLKGHFELNSHTPHPFEKQLMFNHHSWNNEFSRTVETRFEGSLTIPKFDMELFAGYSMVDGMVYYDAIAQARQSEESVHVFSAYLRKDFRLWKFHFDNKILYQMTSSDDVLPLPDLSLNL